MTDPIPSVARPSEPSAALLACCGHAAERHGPEAGGCIECRCKVTSAALVASEAGRESGLLARCEVCGMGERRHIGYDHARHEALVAAARRPRLLDLFSCAGGAAMGYHRAGFEVVGVDIAVQPRYPFEHHVGDALAFLAEHGQEFDVIHASPPCQHYTPLGALHPHKEYPDLVAATREALIANDRPWVIENVMAAPLIKQGSITLCGGMFGLRTYRHRRFEPSIPLTAPAHPKHVIRTATKQRRARWDEGWHVSVTGDVGVYVGPEALGIDWMSGNELCQAIPPAYTEHIGRQFMSYIRDEVAA